MVQDMVVLTYCRQNSIRALSVSMQKYTFSYTFCISYQLSTLPPPLPHEEKIIEIHIVLMTSLRNHPRLPSTFSTFLIRVCWEPDHSYHVKMAAVVSLSWQEQRACQSYDTVAISLPFIAHRLTVIPVPLIVLVPGDICVLRISQCSICFPWATDTVNGLLFRAFMPASLTVILQTIQIPVDDNNDEKSQLNPSIAPLCSEK